ncbi:MAG: hypothetical protein Q8O19_06575 [Rectinemataceae bacterium]|nr:hypothetical protein [Rectinemataceae bacterium]
MKSRETVHCTAVLFFIAVFVSTAFTNPSSLKVNLASGMTALSQTSGMKPGIFVSNRSRSFRFGDLVARKNEQNKTSGLAFSPEALPHDVRKSGSFGKHALRFEIISVGAFPIMLFYTDLGFGIGRYLSSGFDSRYAPWPFRDSSSILPDDSERLVRIGVAAGISFAIAIFDLVTSLNNEAKAYRQSELDSFTPAK